MKNKSLLVVSLLLIAFLIGTSYAPMAAKAETLQEREPATVPPKGESIEQAGGGNNPMAEKWGFYGIPGTALTPVYHEQIYGEDGNGCLWALKGSASNEAFTAPINVPDGARGVRLLGMYMNYQEVPDTPSDIWVYMYRKKWDAATVEPVLSLVLSNMGLGHHVQAVLLDGHVFNSNEYIYFFRVSVEDYERGLCGLQIEYLVDDGIFGLALPVVNK